LTIGGFGRRGLVTIDCFEIWPMFTDWIRGYYRVQVQIFM